MKTKIILLIALINSFISYSQCDCYTVEDIYIPVNTTNIVRVVFKNTCDINVYLQAWLYNSQDEIIASFDECSCGVVFPQNQNVSWDFQSTITSLPPINTLRVKLSNGTLVCDAVTFAQSLSIESNFLVEDNFILYPNPIVDNLTILNSKQLIIQNTTILSLEGKEILSIDGDYYSKEINCNNLQDGLYFLKITTENGQEIVKKIIVSNK